MKSIKWSEYNIKVLADDYTVLFNSVSRGIYLLDNTMLEKVNECIKLQTSPSDEVKKIISKLYQQEFILKTESDEIEKFKEYRYKYYDKIFGTVLYILPTLKCNFVCPYCIQNEYINNSCEEISEATIIQLSKWICEFVIKNKNKIIENQLINKDSNMVKLIFYGGEPSLCNEKNWRLIDILNENLPDWTKLSFTMITNGFNIDNNTLTEYKKRGLSGLQITLDGSPKIHDTRRIPQNGQPTFFNILDTIKRSIHLGIKVALRVNVDESNIDSISSLIDIINDNDLNGKLHLNIAPVDKNCTSTNFYGHQQKVLEKLYDIFKKALISNYTLSMWETFCGVYARSFFVVAPDGGLYKCPSLLNKKHSIGSIYTSEFTPIYEKIITHNIKDQCYECKYVGLCGGGCYNQNIMNDKLQCKINTFKYITEAYTRSIGEYLGRNPSEKRHMFDWRNV